MQLGFVRCGRAFDSVQLLSVVPQDFTPDLFVAIVQAVLDPVMNLVAVKRSRVGKVGFKHDPVNPDLVDQTPRGDLLEPVAGLDITCKILGR